MFDYAFNLKMEAELITEAVKRESLDADVVTEDILSGGKAQELRK